MIIFGISIEMEKVSVQKKLVFLPQPAVRSNLQPLKNINLIELRLIQMKL